MKLQELEKVKKENYKDLSVGFAITTFTANLVALISAIAPLVGLIKTSLASHGEIKDKFVHYKWQLGKDGASKSPTDTFTTFD
ncbi:hypothetical protein [Mycoplasmopsis glycophila]|uniref:Uncharacterized protein n=1 Tax=Mycoplasmopsis glycophila TaxID=171285 RepID=A0A449AUF7_9BACT|nr:hypothetical protein [Mycoplasmopsis glycophila]VEU70118.1 Uncharacterised protein [Mycoplasmopsis glycophila]